MTVDTRLQSLQGWGWDAPNQRYTPPAPLVAASTATCVASTTSVAHPKKDTDDSSWILSVMPTPPESPPPVDAHRLQPRVCYNHLQYFLTFFLLV